MLFNIKREVCNYFEPTRRVRFLLANNIRLAHTQRNRPKRSAIAFSTCRLVRTIINICCLAKLTKAVVL